MQFSVSSKALSGLVSNVGRVVNAKNAITSLNNFLFSLEGNTLAITGSDIDNALSGRIEVYANEGEGKFLIDARRLTTLLKEFAEQPITFTINDENLEVTVKSASGNYSMIGVSADQYPAYKKQTDAEGETASFMCSGDSLLKGIDSTAFAVGTDDYRPPMMGIFLDVKPEGIQGNENIACHYQDGEITIGLSAPYLLEIHNIIKADEVNWLLSDPSRPIVIQPSTQAEHEELTIILMPMSIGE